MTDPVKALVKALRRRCSGLVDIVLDDRCSEDWRTMLFDGARHRFTLLVQAEDIGEALADVKSAMAAPDLFLPGHLIVDLDCETHEIDANHATILMTARTIEDRFAVSV